MHQTQGKHYRLAYSDQLPPMVAHVVLDVLKCAISSVESARSNNNNNNNHNNNDDNNNNNRPAFWPADRPALLLGVSTRKHHLLDI